MTIVNKQVWNMIHQTLYHSFLQTEPVYRPGPDPARTKTTGPSCELSRTCRARSSTAASRHTAGGCTASSSAASEQHGTGTGAHRCHCQRPVSSGAAAAVGTACCRRWPQPALRGGGTPSRRTPKLKRPVPWMRFRRRK
uniref:Uncharacterized protein n=1 Tax=Triticum urartu TaxID=4572 RepID=A0A8R7P299_TRIUA